MKPKFPSAILLTSITFAMVSSAYAADTDGTWTQNANGNWSDGANWSGGTVADGIGFSAYLSNVINANRIITLDSDRTIGSIYAQDTSNNYTISGVNTLTLDTSSGQSILDVVTNRTLTIGTAVTVNDGIEKTGAGEVSITGAVTLGAAQTWTNDSSGIFTKTNASLIDNAGFQLTLDGTGVFNLGTINNATAVLTGSGNLIKNGTGRVNIGGVNSGFTGAVTINGGVMQVNNNTAPLGTGNLTLNGGVFSFYWGTTFTRTLGTGVDQVQIYGESGFAGAGTTGPTINLGSSVMWGANGEGSGATGFFDPTKFVLGDEGTTNAGITTFSSDIDLNGSDRTILVQKGLSNSGNRATISGLVSNSIGTAGLIKEGDGWLLFSSTPTYNGTTTISEGVIEYAALNLNAMGGGAGVRDITIATGAAVRRNGLDNTFLNRLVENSNTSILISGTTGNDLDFSNGGAGAYLPNAYLSTFATNGAKMEYTGTITPADNIYKLGATIQSGLLGIRSTLVDDGANARSLNVNGRVNLVAVNTFTGQTLLEDNARLVIGNNLALQNSALNVGTTSTGRFSLAAGTTAGRVTGETASPSPTFGGLIGSRDLISVFNPSSSGNNELNLAADAITGFTLNTGTGVDVTYSGAIGGFGTGASGGLGGAMTLTKTGAGRQELSGVHTYTGATSITGGTLLISGSGSINSSSGVTINGGALQYNSSVNLSNPLTFTSGSISGTNWNGSLGNLTVGTGQTVSPGNSPGTASTTSQTWAAGGTYVWEINNATGTAGVDPGWDLISGAGTLDITASLGNMFTLDITSLTLGNIAGSAVNFDQLMSYAWMIADFNSVNGFDASDFTINTANFSNTFSGTFAVALGDSGSIGGDNTQIWMTYTAIPEPSVALLSGLGVLLLFRRRR